MSKNGLFENMDKAVSPVAGKGFWSRNFGKSHFGNGKRAVSQEVRKRFFNLRNVKKCSLRER